MHLFHNYKLFLNVVLTKLLMIKMKKSTNVDPNRNLNTF